MSSSKLSKTIDVDLGQIPIVHKTLGLLVCYLQKENFCRDTASNLFFYNESFQSLHCFSRPIEPCIIGAPTITSDQSLDENEWEMVGEASYSIIDLESDWKSCLNQRLKREFVRRFLSERFPHEVTTCFKTRKSIAGWLHNERRRVEV